MHAAASVFHLLNPQHLATSLIHPILPPSPSIFHSNTYPSYPMPAPGMSCSSSPHHENTFTSSCSGSPPPRRNETWTCQHRTVSNLFVDRINRINRALHNGSHYALGLPGRTNYHLNGPRARNTIVELIVNVSPLPLQMICDSQQVDHTASNAQKMTYGMRHRPYASIDMDLMSPEEVGLGVTRKG
jgi:hypothetical protein